MGNSKHETWIGPYKTTVQFVNVFIVSAIACFLLAAYITSETRTSDYWALTIESFDTIGCIATVIATIVCHLFVQSRKYDNLSKMTGPERNNHAVALQKVRTSRDIFLMMFFVFLGITSFRTHKIDNLAVLSCQASGIIFLGLSVLASKMANQIKVTYLNT